jgi:glutamate N-acetyltransferase / amino-acid N-acetyltransferase
MSVDFGPLPSRLPEVEQAPRMPAGFRAGAVRAGIKESGRPDLGVLATTNGPASVAAVFTTNRLAAAPVRLSRQHLAANGGHAVAVISTSGCANAATGAAGARDQARLVEGAAATLGQPPEQVLAISTGLIGTRLPVERLRAPLEGLIAGGLANTDAGLAALAEQMCTTDTRRKAATVRLGGATVTGVSKGVGMIHPQMATMLALILTDAVADPAQLQAALDSAVGRTWNQLTVDGDTSTNDTVFLMASGSAGVAGGPALAPAVEAVARSLARQQAADGEGATTLITCQVSGATNDAAARAVARAVVASSLVKTAVHGRDPNWGRIAAAAGNARCDGVPVEVEEGRLSIGIASVPVFAGRPLDFDAAALAARMDAAELLIRVDLGLGDGVGEAFGCDLTERYVIENSAYST